MIGLLSIATAASTLPHVLLIVADDYGWNDVGYHQNQVSSANPKGLATTDVALKTPVIDQLAAEGRKLEMYYVQPVCSPRAAHMQPVRSPHAAVCSPCAACSSRPGCGVATLSGGVVRFAGTQGSTAAARIWSRSLMAA